MASKKTAAAAAPAADSSKAVTKAGGEVKAKALKIPKATDAPLHPSTLSMVLEALRKNTDRKGATVPSIRTYILSTYPSVDPVRLRVLLRRALAKGMEQGLLIRPTNSTAKGATGRFKLAPARPKTLKKVSENSDPNEERVPKAKKVVSRKPKLAGAAAKKPKAPGDTAKKIVKKVPASSKGEAAAPKAAKKPKEKVATKEATKEKTSGKKGGPAATAASTSKDDTDKDSAKPAAAKRGKK
uniref:Oocyte-type linker histone B4 n=1 Tax=Notophthalmus viridescens TaxID=8316 RepID=D0EUP5_NOTVI|nr:oocyte-type linker histone B4 [Notophthalmus viridescens]